MEGIGIWPDCYARGNIDTPPTHAHPPTTAPLERLKILWRILCSTLYGIPRTGELCTEDRTLNQEVLRSLKFKIHSFLNSKLCIRKQLYSYAIIIMENKRTYSFAESASQAVILAKPLTDATGYVVENLAYWMLNYNILLWIWFHDIRINQNSLEWVSHIK